MSDHDNSPRHPSLRGYLPLSEDVNPLSTRGQSLPGLIQNRSSSNLALLRRTSVYQLAGALEDAEDGRPRSTLGHEHGGWESESRRNSLLAQMPASLMTPQMRSQRLIGNSNPRYRWEQYYKTEEQLKGMKRPIRKYYEQNNQLIQQYIFIDRLLDSSLPHNLIQEYQQSLTIPSTINEDSGSAGSSSPPLSRDDSFLHPPNGAADAENSNGATIRVKRTPKNIYKLPEETTPLLSSSNDSDAPFETYKVPAYEPGEEADSNAPIVKWALWLNIVANFVLLVLKIVVTVLTSSLSVLASLVDAILDFLCTAIIALTTWLIQRKDPYAYPVGRRRLEAIGVLVFSVIMIVSFFQVALEGMARLTSSDHTIVQLSLPAVLIMASTVVIKGLAFIWCRVIPNTAVRALAQDALTDVVFNTFSIVFPLIGFFAKIWWLDPLGGVLLSLYVIINWSHSALGHIRRLAGSAATADERNVLLYLTMRFAKSVKQIQGLSAYHSGDKLIVEVDIVLDEHTSLRDSHDVGESLQYVLESVPTVDRAFVHLDYAGYNLPTHMEQQCD
ncbi:hypothetical protein P152DRAFT_322590 [Eremomyces bilateralis CBS 781.70]|uniref:Cation diffusion facilitator 10 n=1 Tax=Eremomyces bilateralis CBS 781.70 TaxID=1392243 RepID=A0A6G1G612_9PEZI|nr:uncharacterized protein P152DRAFT_322590 [Eremomyces bilateralis CBS 781.70]KAF1813507.1 hypothetical protein P152DRAFT_322590 [Eremomyces bilateralis CBS 781.70]